MYASEQSEQGKFSHFCIQNLLFLSLFVLILQIFCWYNMTFNREILGGGGGMIIQAIPPPNILGGIYPPPPHPPGIDTHDVKLFNHVMNIVLVLLIINFCIFIYLTVMFTSWKNVFELCNCDCIYIFIGIGNTIMYWYRLIHQSINQSINQLMSSHDQLVIQYSIKQAIY